MSCKKEWDRNFMYNTMTKTFVIETLKEHSEKLMLEREKALLPLTQPIVERVKRLNVLNSNHNIINKKISQQKQDELDAMFTLRRTRSDLIANGLRMKNQDISISEMATDSDQSDDERQHIHQQQAKFPTELQTEIQNWKQKRRERIKMEQERDANYRAINQLIRKNSNRINALENYAGGTGNITEYVTSSSDEDAPGDSTSRSSRRAAKRTFVRACPNENCKGFLSTRWICGLCECNVCSKCHEIKSNGEHTCDPNNVATAQMLMNDTRSCPSCSVQIHKIDGCNMMFCTQCHTPFCWKTGEIIRNQRIHNPHYYEWLRQNSTNGNIPREPGDEIGGAGEANRNGCRNRISIRAIRDKLEQYDLNSYDLEDILWNVHRVNLHIEMVEIPILTIYNRRDQVDLRMNYMLNRYTERKWKQELYRRAKRDEKNISIQQVYEMVNAVLNDELYKIITTEPLTFQYITDLVAMIENLRNYTNQQFLDISKIYQCRVPKIEEQTWNINYQRADWSIRKKHKFKENTTTEYNNCELNTEEV
jgi:hypothetical protein